jgi:hypothetical protein
MAGRQGSGNLAAFPGAGVAGFIHGNHPYCTAEGIGAQVTLHALLGRAGGFKAGVLRHRRWGRRVPLTGFDKYCQIRSYRIQA